MVDYADEGLFLQDSVDKQISIISDDQTINISNDDIVGEEFELTESLCSEDNLRFGSVESSCIRFRVKNTFPKMMKKWLTVTITPHGAEEPFTIGRYYVRKEKPSSDRSTKEITAYDGMYPILQNTYLSWYKTAFNSSRQTTIKDFRDAFFERLAQTHPWISQEVVDLPNDSCVFKRVKKLNRRDLSGQNILKAICEINGVCGRLGRDNVFHYYAFDNTVEPQVITKTLTISVDYEDYTTTAIDRVEFLNEKGGVYAQYGADSSSANNTYVVESNFLIRGISKSIVTEFAEMMLNSITNARFTPIDAEFKGNPCYEVGDLIQFTANGSNIKSFILQRRMKGIQSLHDFYESQGKKEYPTVSSTTTAKIKTNSEKIGTIEKSDYSLVSNLDGGMEDIGYSDSDLESISIVTSDPENVGKRTMEYWCWNTLRWDAPNWAVWRGLTLQAQIPFVVVECKRNNARRVEVDGKVREEKNIYLIGRWEGYAGSALSQLPLEQDFEFIRGTRSKAEMEEIKPAFSGSGFNNMYNVGVTSLEYWWCSMMGGSTAVGLIDEAIPADYKYDSLEAIAAAINNGEIKIDETSNTPSDYVTKLPTKSSANDLCKAIINLGGVQNQTRGALRSSVEDNDDFIVGSNIMGDESLKKITSSINKLGTNLLSNVKDIYESVGSKSRGLVALLFSGGTRWLADIPSFFKSKKDKDDVSPSNNTIFFNLDDNSGIEIEKKSEHDWGIEEPDFSADDYGYETEVYGNRDSGETAHQYATLKLSGLGQGITHTIKMKETIPFSYNFKKTYLMWLLRESTLTVVELTVNCSSPFVLGAYKTQDSPISFTYNGQTYSKYPYDICFEVDNGVSTSSPTITVSQNIIYYEQYEQGIPVSTTPIHPSEWSSRYYYFPTYEIMTFGFFEEGNIDYVYDDLEDLKDSIGNVNWKNRIFVYGKPLGVLFSDSDTVSDFSSLPTDRGTWHSTEKFHSFYADVDSTHELTCQFASTADTMYAHFIMDGFADCVSASSTAGVKITELYDSLMDMYIKKIYGRWGDRWYQYLAESGGGGSSTFAGLTDVSLTNLQNGQVPKYNATTQKWENANESGGGGGGSYTRTELYKSSTNLAVWDANGITLSDDIENYDEIEFVLGFASGTDLSKRTNKFGAKWFADNFAYSSAVTTVSHALLLLWPNQGLSAAWDSTNKKVMIWGRNGTVGIYAVYGIKCGGGGGGSSTLAGLTDVDIDTPTDGQTILYNSTENKFVNGTVGVHYSTTEHVIGTWIDGKPLYERTFTNGTTASNFTNAAILADLGTGHVIRAFEGIVDNTRALNAFLDNYSRIYTWITADGYRVANYATGTAHAGKSCVVTVRYTKTTDTVS